MLNFEMNSFAFDEVDNLCVSARMRLDSDERIPRLRVVARRLLSESDVPFLEMVDAIAELASISGKLLAREGFDSANRNDIALVIALLSTEYRLLPTTSRNISYEDIFKECFGSFLFQKESSISPDDEERLRVSLDKAISERSMYNTYLFMETCLDAAFEIMAGISDNREEKARVLASHLDSLRDTILPRGNIWQSMVMKILLRSRSLKDAIENDFHLDAKEDLHIYDTCYNSKQVDYSDDFYLELFESFKKNEIIYHIHEAILPSSWPSSNNGQEILVYDRSKNVIKKDYFNTYEMSCVPIYCMGTVNDYVSSFLNIDMLRFSGYLDKLYQYADLYDVDEKQISAQACDRIDEAVQAVFGIKQDDGVFQKAHVFFVSRWLRNKVNLNLCSRQQFIEGISNLCILKEAECEDLPKYEQEEFENSLDEYFYNYAFKYGADFYRYLKFAVPLLDDYDSKNTFPRSAYAKCLIEYYLYQTQTTNIEVSVQRRLIDILSDKHPFDYYIDRISRAF